MVAPIVALVAPAARLASQGAAIALGGWAFNKLIGATGPSKDPEKEAAKAERYRNLLLHVSPHIGLVSRLALQSAARGDTAADRVLGDLNAAQRDFYTLLRRGPNKQHYDIFGFAPAIAAVGQSAVGAYTAYLGQREAAKAQRAAEAAATERAFAEWARANRSRLRTRIRENVANTLANYEEGRNKWAETYSLVDEVRNMPYFEAATDTPYVDAYDKRRKGVKIDPRQLQALRQKNRALREENKGLQEEMSTLGQRHAIEIANERLLGAAVPQVGAQSYFGGGEGGYGGEMIDDPFVLNSYLGAGAGPGIDSMSEWDVPEEFEEMMDVAPCLLPDIGEIAELARSGYSLDASPAEAPHETKCYEAGYRPDGKLRSGTFYESPRVRATIVDSLGDGVHGMIDLAGAPKPIRIAAQSGSARATYATAHELAHYLDDRVKAGVNHEQVNSMGHAIVEDVFPAMQAFYERAMAG